MEEIHVFSKKTIEDDVFLYPVDIGRWSSYSSYSHEEQKELQKENLFDIKGLIGAEGQIRLIYSKTIADLSDYLDNVSKTIHLSDTTVVLENEVFYTSKIEGARTTRVRTSEIHNGFPVNKNNYKSEIMVKNGFAAVKLLNLYNGKPLTKEILCKIWETLIKDCCENTEIRGNSGEYRIGDVDVGEHKGLLYTNLDEIMGKFIEFYNSNYLDDKPFIKAGIIHYAYENIHPFCDGNGRLGRLLMNNYLISRGIESAKAVSFSMQIDKNRGLYDGSFIAAENEMGDITPFIEYMLDIMAEAYGTALASMR